MQPALLRFLEAQERVLDRALAELGAGAKHGHWMWFVFPQIKGLGRSAASHFYGIDDLAEARAYLAHPQLGPRLAHCTAAMQAWAGWRPAETILGPVDAQKFASSMTLFEAAGGNEAFGQALDALNGGQRCAATLALLGANGQ